MFYNSEIPIRFNFLIIRNDAIIEKNNGDILEFLIKFKPLHNEFISVIISMGTDWGDTYDWIREKKLIGLADYYLGNEIAHIGISDEKEDYIDTPKWLTIFKNEKGLFVDYLNTKKFFYTDIEIFKKSKGCRD